MLVCIGVLGHSAVDWAVVTAAAALALLAPAVAADWCAVALIGLGA